MQLQPILVFIWCLYSTQAYVAPNTKKYKDSRTTCLKRMNIPVNKNGNPIDKEDKSLKCLKQCMLREIRTVLDNDEPNYKEIADYALNTATLCNNIAIVYANNSCRRVNRFDKCMTNNVNNTMSSHLDGCDSLNVDSIDMWDEKDACKLRCFLKFENIIDSANNLLMDYFIINEDLSWTRKALDTCNPKTVKERDPCRRVLLNVQCVENMIEERNRLGGQGGNHRQKYVDYSYY